MDNKDLIKTIKDGYERRIKHFELEKKTYDCVIVGDSMVAYMHTKKFFPHTSIMNQGIAGDTTQGLSKRLHYIKKVQPKTIFISIGSNDLVLLKSNPDEVAKSIFQCYQNIKTQNPHATIYVFNITPVNDTLETSNHVYISHRNNKDIITINKKLTELLDETVLIDVYHRLVDQNHLLDKQYTQDGIHLNEKGYQLYTNKMMEKW